jgi:hypothetical protein
MPVLSKVAPPLIFAGAALDALDPDPITKLKTRGLIGSRSSSSSGGGYVPHAYGGIMTSPHLGLVAESGAEAIIPLSPGSRDRGLDVWGQAGEMLGAGSGASGGMVISAPVSIANVSFEVNVDGASSADDIIKILRANVSNLTDEIANNIAISLEQTFANMPLVAQ